MYEESIEMLWLIRGRKNMVTIMIIWNSYLMNVFLEEKQILTGTIEYLKHLIVALNLRRTTMIVILHNAQICT